MMVGCKNYIYSASGPPDSAFHTLNSHFFELLQEIEEVSYSVTIQVFSFVYIISHSIVLQFQNTELVHEHCSLITSYSAFVRSLCLHFPYYSSYFIYGYSIMNIGIWNCLLQISTVSSRNDIVQWLQ